AISGSASTPQADRMAERKEESNWAMIEFIGSIIGNAPQRTKWLSPLLRKIFGFIFLALPGRGTELTMATCQRVGIFCGWLLNHSYPCQCEFRPGGICAVWRGRRPLNHSFLHLGRWHDVRRIIRSAGV